MAKNFRDFLDLLDSPASQSEMRGLVERDKRGYCSCTPEGEQNDADLAWRICDTITNYKLRKYHEWVNRP